MKRYIVDGSGHSLLNVALHVSTLNEKVFDVAEQAGVAPSGRLDLETALAALPWRSRRRVGLLLEGARASASNEAQQIAADLVLSTAEDI